MATGDNIPGLNVPALVFKRLQWQGRVQRPAPTSSLCHYWQRRPQIPNASGTSVYFPGPSATGPPDLQTFSPSDPQTLFDSRPDQVLEFEEELPFGLTENLIDILARGIYRAHVVCRSDMEYCERIDAVR